MAITSTERFVYVATDVESSDWKLGLRGISRGSAAPLIHRLDLEGHYLDSRWIAPPRPIYEPWSSGFKVIDDELLVFVASEQPAQYESDAPPDKALLVGARY
ncbi:MAG TPA: hypothetical protein VNG33_15755 [Polyangiaceae bacterium]|nr:hypothetical protein [Polyangiaceae bacterium]